MSSDIQVVIGYEARESIGFAPLHHSYQELMRSFHGSTFFCDKEFFSSLLRSRSEILVFAIQESRVVGSAQASLLQSLPVFQAAINNVVVAPEIRGSGVGRRLLEKIEEAVKVQWSKNRALKLFLTNSPDKKNGAFYVKLGFTARTKENANESTVWEKLL